MFTQCSSRIKATILASLLILVAVGAVFYYGGKDSDDKPPTLSTGSATIQGMLEKGKQGFLEFEAVDSTAYASRKGLYSGTPITLKKGVNYLYVDKEYTLKDLVECVNPAAERILFAQYNYNEGKFFTYPKGPFEDATKEITDKNSYKLKAGEAFVIISRKDAEAYCMKNGEKKAEKPVTQPMPDDKSGWVLIAAHNDKLSDEIKPYEDRVKSVFKLSGQDSFEKVEAKDYGAALDKYLLWVKLDKKGAKASGVTGGSKDTTAKLQPALKTETKTEVKTVTKADVATVPGAPKGVKAETPVGATVLLKWDAPDSDGGNPITKYEVSVKDFSNLSTTILTVSLDAPNTGFGFINTHPSNTTYEFKVRAVNGIGEGPYSALIALTIGGAVAGHPAPTGLTVSTPYNDTTHTLSLSWVPPTPPAGLSILNYTVKYSKPSDTVFPVYEGMHNSSPVELVDFYFMMDPGGGIDVHAYNTYKFSVRANYSGGVSSDYSPEITYELTVQPAAAAAYPAPTNLASYVYPNDPGTVNLTWDAPAEMPADRSISYYTLQFFNVNDENSFDEYMYMHEIGANQCTLVGLPGGTYKFSVRARYDNSHTSVYSNEVQVLGSQGTDIPQPYCSNDLNARYGVGY